MQSHLIISNRIYDTPRILIHALLYWLKMCFITLLKKCMCGSQHCSAEVTEWRVCNSQMPPIVTESLL